MINFKSKIYVAGHKGLVGSAIVRKLNEKGYRNIIFEEKSKLDLTDQAKVLIFLKKHKPDFVFIAAAKVGGILSNKNFKAEYITQNLQIQTNLIYSSYLSGVKNLIFLGSSCIYPKKSKQPIKEKYLLTGKLEESNDAYAVAKIAGIKMCQSYNEQYNCNYKCLMPANTFGPNDDYDENNSHFLPALIKKSHQVKINNLSSITLWGNGKVKREFIHVDDLAEACVFFMKKKTNHFLINVGTGKDYTINYYANLISEIILKKKIKINYDKSKPNGVQRKVLDITIAKKYGWKPKLNLKKSIINTYKSFLEEIEK